MALQSTAAAKTSSQKWLKLEMRVNGDGRWRRELGIFQQGQEATNGLEIRCGPTVDLPNLK